MQTQLLAHIGPFHTHTQDWIALAAVALVSILIFVAFEVTGRKQ